MKTFPRVFRPLAIAAAVLALTTGCATNLCQIRDPGTGQPVPETFTGTVNDTHNPKNLAQPAVLRRVDSISCNGFDRVVFQFDGAAVPGYHAAYVDQPITQCGSGNTVQVAGDAWLEIRMTPAQAHTDEGAATVTDRNRLVNQPNLRQLVSTCDFEGNVTWVLGLASPTRYRILELSSPPRLVLDVKH